MSAYRKQSSKTRIVETEKRLREIFSAPKTGKITASGRALQNSSKKHVEMIVSVLSKKEGASK